MEVKRNNGIYEALKLLRQTDCPETQKQLTGLLWNLSSADELKPELVRDALPSSLRKWWCPSQAGQSTASSPTTAWTQRSFTMPQAASGEIQLPPPSPAKAMLDINSL
ncbi:hypothetical protein AOXY_G36054 [Acipenser oxyrinchus oxyrinchus]|uniref:Uncharacterized protein n=1 Tax=Acipenser oxyrinchus oxyrinchus TaxID=40147 RepID=A0AAD8FRX2_ACIOX|nr:hypothetical protein AOXY_G36054 [Acipenser oxyrinchus oxyrinchus]